MGKEYSSATEYTYRVLFVECFVFCIYSDMTETYSYESLFYNFIILVGQYHITMLILCLISFTPITNACDNKNNVIIKQ